MTPQMPQSKPTGFFDRFFFDAAAAATAESNLYIGGVLLLGGAPPDFTLLHRYLADQATQVPALRYRLSARRTHWEVDPGFTPGNHIDEVRLDQGADVLAAAMDAIGRPLQPERPLWGLTALHGHSSDEYALCYRAHHAFQDGMGMLQTAAGLLSTPRQHANRATAGKTTSFWPWLSPTGLGIPLRRTARWSESSNPLTGHRALRSAHLDVARLQAIAEATGASFNQICLTVLTGALRAWTPHDWTQPTSARARRGLHVAVPLDLRPTGSELDPGNHLGVVRVALPCTESAPLTQLRHIRAQTGPARLRRHRNLHRSLLNALPYKTARSMMLRIVDPRHTVMVVSTLDAPAALTFAKAPILGLHALPPLLPGHRGMVVFIRHHNIVTASLVFDNAVADTERLPGLMHEATNQLHALVS